MIRPGLLGAIAGVAVALACGGGPAAPDTERSASTRGNAVTDAPAGPGEAGPVDAPAAPRARVPRTPPARICGSQSLRRGPTTKPRGAVVVRPSQRLDLVVQRHRPGTTYWLKRGTYTFGGSQWGQVIPESGDTFIGAPGAVLDGRGINLYAFTGTARDVTIRYLTITRFGKRTDNSSQGVVNHDSGRGWVVEHNTIRGNGGAGVFLGSRGRVVGNCLEANGQYGFQALDSRGGRLAHNEVTGNNTADWEARWPGCGCTGGGKFWKASNVSVVGNWVHDNHGVGLWADTNNRGLLFMRNYIADNDAEGILYETSYNARIVGNTFLRNGWVKGPTNPGFPTGAIYISESGSDSRVPGRYGQVFHIVRNHFVDNWSGVVTWENADRFAGSPNNTSTGVYTLVNPEVANRRTCVAGTIDQKPYIDDCRWKTKQLRIEGNTFVLHRDRVPGCRVKTGCGYQGLFSNWGSSPDWSPYMGPMVQRNIVWHQNNKWRQNSYRGSWRFMVWDQATVVRMKTWKSKYHQDAGSRVLR